MLNRQPTSHEVPFMRIKVARQHIRGYRQLSLLLMLWFMAAPIVAQQPATSSVAPPRQAAKLSDPTFDTLLSTDAYKLYGEVRNVGQLLNTGGAGEIVDPIIKLADPGPEFKSIVNFLRKNSESLFTSRLMFATWRARTDVPTFLVAIEFPTSEDATKFAPKLEKFMPSALPPVPVPTESWPVVAPTPADSAAASAAPPAKAAPPANKPKSQAAEEIPYVITRAGNLVCISDKDLSSKNFVRRGRISCRRIRTFAPCTISFRLSRSFSFSTWNWKIRPNPSLHQLRSSALKRRPG